MKKLDILKRILRQYTSAVVAFSGGVDSTLLAYIAGEVLENNVLLVTASSAIFPDIEIKEAKETAALLNLNQQLLVFNEADIPKFLDNPPERCYYCKRELFTRMKSLAVKEGYDIVFDGSNASDSNDYRPGRKALTELSIKSPLCEAGLAKAEIRDISREIGLPTAQKPSYSCLASRFPYGEKITRAKLKRVDQAERALHALGFTQFRVRSHGDMARIEFTQDEIELGWAKRRHIQTACKKAGFIHVAIDTEGYRTGAMNEALRL